MKKLKELTIWAIYTMHFANTKQSYIDSWQLVISNRAETQSVVINAAIKALRIYNPVWKNSKLKGSIKY